ncbi:hypothetical protein B0H16DRAFT_553022 [Mycena metata]|uniref:Uncharacterized protein n=1 Tax=Mycena metata TaxID=1033252 RepID=A0AAD7H5E6_9AGAR|nr:hypothetical protein B0H16DRAFT_553022 [Mycena metata]
MPGSYACPFAEPPKIARKAAAAPFRPQILSRFTQTFIGYPASSSRPHILPWLGHACALHPSGGQHTTFKLFDSHRSAHSFSEPTNGVDVRSPLKSTTPRSTCFPNRAGTPTPPASAPKPPCAQTPSSCSCSALSPSALPIPTSASVRGDNHYHRGLKLELVPNTGLIPYVTRTSGKQAGSPFNLPLPLAAQYDARDDSPQVRDTTQVLRVPRRNPGSLASAPVK